jgi:hypothetical protein
VNIKRVALLVIVALTFLSIGIYSQTKRPNVLLNVPLTTYSGNDLGFTVTSTNNGRIEGFFVIKAKDGWIPIPDKLPEVKSLQSSSTFHGKSN